MSANTSRINSLEVSKWAEAQLTASPEQSKQLRNNSSLPPDAWQSIDDTLYRNFDDTLRVVQDLRAAGLTTQESIYSKESVWDLLGGEHEASVDMDPETATDEGAVTYDRDGVPLPLVHDDFSIGFRDEAPQGERKGGGLQSLNAEEATRSVAEALERLALYGDERFRGGKGYDLWGLANFPNAHTGTLGDWETNPNSARDDFRAMMNDIRGDEIFPGNGGYWTYISRDLEYDLDNFDDYGDGDTTIRERLNNLSGLGRIEVSDYLDSGTAVTFAPRREVIDLAVMQEESVIQWDDPLRSRFKVLSGMVPRVKETYDGQVGIAVYQQ